MFLSRAALLLVALFACSSAEADLVFHFDFAKAGDRTELQDQTGTFRCLSESGTFQVEKEALRLASGARITIPSEGLPDLTREMTVAAWILKSGTPDVAPILSQGLHPEPGGFLFSVGWRYPAFSYRKSATQKAWDGLSYQGYFGSTIAYTNPSWIFPGAQFVETGGKWYHVAAVFREGSVRVFVDGKPSAAFESARPSRMKPSPRPLDVGSAWSRLDNGKIEPDAEANMLLNDLRLYNAALPDTEIAAIYKAERSRYPLESQIPEGKTHTAALPPCFAYLGPEYDPNFARTLKITEDYEKTLESRKVPNEPLTARNILVGGIPGFAINEEPVYPLAVCPAPLNFATNELMVREAGACVRDFAAAGVNLVGLDIIPRTFWKNEGKYDWGVVDDMFRTYLAANPSAKILFGLPLYPPTWFETRFPDDMEKYFHGGAYKVMRLAGPLGSDRWLEVSLKMIRDVVSHIESGPYANRVFGYMCGGGQSGEWYWPGGLDGPTGYSQATTKTFQMWLHDKYAGDVARVRAAWNQGEVEFSTAAPPPPEIRNKKAERIFLAPGADGWERDFREYLTDRTVRNMEESARAVREASHGKKLVYLYYGYALASTGRPKLHTNGLQGLERILDCKDIDGVWTLIDYVRRRQGQAGLSITPFHASARLRGKFIWLENDTRTHLARGAFAAEKTQTWEETLSVIQRGFGDALAEGTGMWWRLFENDWYHQEEVMRGISTLSKIGEAALKKDRSPVAEVALIYDETVPYFLANAAQDFLREHVWGTTEGAAHMGAPYDVLLLSDLGRPDTKDYKLYIFLNAWRNSPGISELIKNKVKKNNAVAVWAYAPGYLNDDKTSVDGMKNLTGIRLEEKTVMERQSMRPTDKQHAITKNAQEGNAFEMAPAFFSNDPEARVLGTVAGHPALVVKEFENWRSVFTLMPLTREILQGLCDYAGVHVFLRSFDVFHANKTYLMLHTVTAGKKTISLPVSATVRELISGRTLAKDATTFTEDLPPFVTRIYAIEPTSAASTPLPEPVTSKKVK
ncbi:MAG: LamG domain-containing protein [Chthoniobacterales bacterium]|nr:LamG domain-containing protein [Chthoniobacterales bacterium]